MWVVWEVREAHSTSGQSANRPLWSPREAQLVVLPETAVHLHEDVPWGSDLNWLHLFLSLGWYSVSSQCGLQPGGRGRGEGGGGGEGGLEEGEEEGRRRKERRKRRRCREEEERNMHAMKDERKEREGLREKKREGGREGEMRREGRGRAHLIVSAIRAT